MSSVLPVSEQMQGQGVLAAMLLYTETVTVLHICTVWCRIVDLFVLNVHFEVGILQCTTPPLRVLPLRKHPSMRLPQEMHWEGCSWATASSINVTPPPLGSRLP